MKYAAGRDDALGARRGGGRKASGNEILPIDLSRRGKSYRDRLKNVILGYFL